ncbi:PAS domain-containing sensor histidine kinase [Saprospiraceae bacterium]|nr:PAS domain-containing sensor histidine kinase [Saprospiraceae bacterium]
MKPFEKDFTLLLESVIETAIDGIMTIDEKGLVETMNSSAASLFGYKVKDVIGNNIKMLMPSPYHEEHDGYLHRYKKTKKPHIIGIGREVIGLKKTGEKFPFRLAVSEVILNDRVIYTGIIHDLTDVKIAQEEIIKLNKDLEQTVVKRTYELEKVVNQMLSTNKHLESEIAERKLAEKKLKENELILIDAIDKEKKLNEMKSRFVSMASHEFRTPLTSILSSASLISRYETLETQENRMKHVGKIKMAVSNLTGILNDFLSLGVLEEGQVNLNYTNIDLEQLCMEVTESTKSLIKDERKVNHKSVGEPRTLNSDTNIVRNILFNLISNAIKYSSEDVNCYIYYNPDNLQIQIQDSGIGIPIEDQQYLFTRFFRAGNVTNIDGTGLGLNIVKRYIELLGGDISFKSIQEEGTTFTVNLPYQNAE